MRVAFGCFVAPFFQFKRLRFFDFVKSCNVNGADGMAYHPPGQAKKRRHSRFLCCYLNFFRARDLRLRTVFSRLPMMRAMARLS